MAKMNMATPYDSNYGKYAHTDQIYFKIRKFDQQTLAVRLKHPTTNEPPSAAQQTAQTKLAEVAALVKAALANPERKTELKAEWKKQKRYKTLTGFAFHKLYHSEEGGNNG